MISALGRRVHPFDRVSDRNMRSSTLRMIVSVLWSENSCMIRSMATARVVVSIFSLQEEMLKT